MSVNKRSYILPIFCLALSATDLAAQVTSRSPDPASLGMTSGRLVATLAAVVALIGAVVGALALARPAGMFGTTLGRLGPIVAGIIGVSVGGFVVANTASFGTGGGRAGAIVALVLNSFYLLLTVLFLILGAVAGNSL